MSIKILVDVELLDELMDQLNELRERAGERPRQDAELRASIARARERDAGR